MKSIKRIFIIVSIFVFLILSVDYVIDFKFYQYASRWQYTVKDFDVYKADFQRLAELAKSYEDEADKTNIHFMFIGNKNGVSYISYQGKLVNLSEKELESLDKIKKSFKSKDALFDTIFIYNNRISFNIENGQYALVYSFDDSEPTFVNNPNEKQGVYVKKICDNWYHVVLNPN